MKLLLSHIADLDGITPIILMNLLGKEFDYVIKSEKVSAEAVLGEDEAVEDNICEVYDIIIAGVACE